MGQSVIHVWLSIENRQKTTLIWEVYFLRKKNTFCFILLISCAWFEFIFYTYIFFWFVGILVFLYSIKIIFLYTSAIFDIKSIFWHKFHASMKFSDNFNTWSVMYNDNIRKRMQISHKKSIECSVQFQCKMRNNIFALSHKRSKQKKGKQKIKRQKKPESTRNRI